MKQMLAILLVFLSLSVFSQEQAKPFAVLEGIEAGLVELETLLGIDNIKCSNNNYQILSFTLSLKHESGDIVQITSKSSEITSQMKEFLWNENFENKIYFEDIKALSQDGQVIELQPIIITLNK